MLKKLELHGFKSFDKKTSLDLTERVSAIVGPNGSGKSNVAEALRWVLGEQSMKSMRGKRGEDLIFNGSKMVAKQNRAHVSIHFDNKARRIPIDFDDVIITREVYRDGENRYLINGSQVRLKDVLELLASVGIGGTSHHIISQGEADRIIMAKPDLRREMIEEALGLAVHQWKRDESERKLAKTEENIKEAHMQKRELGPQMRALKAEIEKLERYSQVRDELTAAYVDYFSYGFALIAKDRERLTEEIGFYERKYGEYQNDVPNVAEELRAIRQNKEDAMRALGRTEGALEAAAALEAQMPEEEQEAHVREPISGICATCGQIVPQGQEYVPAPVPVRAPVQQQIDTEPLLAQKSELEQKLAGYSEEEKRLHEEEKVVRQFYAQKSELRRLLEEKKENLSHNAGQYERLQAQLREALDRAGRPVLEFENRKVSHEDTAFSWDAHMERNRGVDRLAIRLEELGGADEDVRTQYKDLLAKEEYITREIEDLKNGATSLEGLIDELAKRVDTEFREGVSKINDQFQQFFTILFGGGNASLEPVLLSLPHEPPQYGLDVSIIMPHKKVRGLQMLSGGERALASIALVFALSQVNPPPFLVLDETDAALDESNSRRYADMIARLADQSQLVIITHNRETMARADTLYGVTMGEDGTSRVLSVKLEK